MIVLLAVIFGLFLKRKLVNAAVEQARSDVRGRMEGHAQMNMSVADDRPFLKRLFSADGFTAVSHFFVSDSGSSFGGVIAFLFADLIVPPILDIYRRYYGWRMAAFCWSSSTSPWRSPPTPWRSASAPSA